MKSKPQHIRVFEHEIIKLNQKFEEDVIFGQTQLDAFVHFYDKGVPYFNLMRNGIRFNEYVGAIQIGNTLIEVLPKPDKRKVDKDDKIKWSQILINMLRVVHGFEVKAPSSSNLKIKNNSVLDLYFELFVKEVEYLLHRGLVKKYRKTQDNLTALKGRLLFSKQISKNLVHQERFYTEFTTYDAEHVLHIIIYQTLLVLKKINHNPSLNSNINALLLNFPEMPNQKITAATFDKIIFNRKTLSYQKALDIAKLILLQYHPDLSKGKNDVLALMFDMNFLWEKFVLVSLQKNKKIKVRGQNSRYFWQPHGGNRRSIRPDITIHYNNQNYVIDTKWKLVDNKPSMEDIRQMYAYHHYFEADKVALLYPGINNYTLGNFVNIDDNRTHSDLECGLMFSQHHDSVKEWQKDIVQLVLNWTEDKAVKQSR